MSKDDRNVTSELNGFQAPNPADGFFDRLDEAIAAEPIPQRHNVRRLARTTGLSIFPVGIAAAVLLAFLLPHSSSKTPNIAAPTFTTQAMTPTSIKTLLAADITAKAEQTFAQIKGLSATINFKSNRPDSQSTTTQLRLQANGDYWQSTGSDTTSYVAATGVLTDCGSLLACTKTPGLIDGDPGSRPESSYLTLLSTLRNAQTDPNSTLEDTTYNGRPAWKITANTTVRQIETAVVTPDADEPVVITLIVDQQTVFPVDEKVEQNNKYTDETTVTNLNVDPTFTTKDLDAADGKPVAEPVGRAQYVRTSLNNLKSGYTALPPANVPDGFELAEVSTGVNNFYADDPTSNAFANNVVVLTYRRGTESFTITSRSTGKVKWTDPIEMNLEEATDPQTKTVAIKSGTFAGTNATLVVRPNADHVWGLNNHLVFTINGSLSDDDLIAVANSL